MTDNRAVPAPPRPGGRSVPRLGLRIGGLCCYCSDRWGKERLRVVALSNGVAKVCPDGELERVWEEPCVRLRGVE